MADFHFCGKNKVPGLPYCEFHARRAFQPPQARRREREIVEVCRPARHRHPSQRNRLKRTIAALAQLSQRAGLSSGAFFIVG